MRKSNPRVWAAIGATVGVFLTPSGWLLLLAAFIGPQLADLGDGDSGSLVTDVTLPPELGGEPIGEDPQAAEGTGTPGWFVALLAVSLAITVLTAVFFGWLGYRIAEARNQRLGLG